MRKKTYHCTACWNSGDIGGCEHTFISLDDRNSNGVPVMCVLRCQEPPAKWIEGSLFNKKKSTRYEACPDCDGGILAEGSMMERTCIKCDSSEC